MAQDDLISVVLDLSDVLVRERGETEGARDREVPGGKDVVALLLEDRDLSAEKAVPKGGLKTEVVLRTPLPGDVGVRHGAGLDTCRGAGSEDEVASETVVLHVLVSGDGVITGLSE